MNRISTTWELAKVSWGVLRDDKELALLPVLSAVCAILVSITFFVPLIAVPKIEDSLQGGIVPFIGMFLFYLVNYFVVIFFNTALIHGATIRLRGGHPTLKDALSFAWENAGRILQWAAVSATVGMILRAIEERVGWLGRVIVWLVGAAWTVATFFVIPVIVYEQLGPIDAVKRSAGLFKETWGERAVGSVSFGLLFFLLAIPGIALPFLVGALLGSTAGLIFGALAIVYLIGLAIVSSALSGIFLAALYQYAQNKEASGPFSQQMLGGAWRPR